MHPGPAARLLLLRPCQGTPAACLLVPGLLYLGCCQAPAAATLLLLRAVLLLPAHLKFSLSSGAPPVMSTVVMLPAACCISCTQRSAVALSIISVRRGELSTWQWLHAWLQYSPTFIWKMVAGERLRGVTPGAWQKAVWVAVCDVV